MKKMFNKIKGKQEPSAAREGNRNSATTTARPTGSASSTTGDGSLNKVTLPARPKDSALTAPALDLVNRYLDTPRTPVRPAQPSQPDPRTPAASKSGKLRISSSAPLNQILGTLALPASSTMVKGTDLVFARPPAEVCPVCCNLDANSAPRDGDGTDTKRSWAHSEYRIPEGTPVAKKTIEKGEDLLESATRGCFYCCLVQMAIHAVEPGWETEKTFIDIFLAPGLPVVLRLHYGAISRVKMGREAMLELGVDMPEGQNMEFTIVIENPEKPPVDVEVYRPRLDPDQFTVGDTALMPLAEQIGFGREVPDHSGDEDSIKFAKDNIAKCVKEHRCGKDGYLPLLPDRVIWIAAQNETGIQLVEPKNIHASYLALSYCWGSVSADTFLTNRSTFEARKAGMDFEELPPLFQDVVDFARALNIDYIWIDRLCIIQGDVEDFKSQAPKMGSFYGNATLTIAAAAASSEMDPIFIDRDSKWYAFDLHMNVGGIGSVKLRTRRRTHSLGTENKGGAYGKVSTRAWIWQERLLAARSLFITPSAMKFECNCHSVWEGFDQTAEGHSWSNQLDTISHQSWTRLVEEYTKREITRPSDRLPAMEAVMERISKSTGWSPIWGLWVNTLVESLGWESMELNSLTKRPCRMNPEYYAPTWSWASVDGPISYVSAQPDSAMEGFDPMTQDIECRRLDAASGQVTFSGRLIPCQVTVKVDRQEQAADSGKGAAVVAGEDSFKYTFTTSMRNKQDETSMKPDVPLMPWSGTINGQFVKTVIRVPHGKPQPRESWSGECYCLLLGRRKLRSLVLYLGRSVRVPGALERIGMVDGLTPSVFEGVQKQLIIVV